VFAGSDRVARRADTSDALRGRVYHIVCNGREETVALEDDPLVARAREFGRFNNTLHPQSLARVRRVIEAARSVRRPVRTAELVRRARAGADEKGALGALRVLDLEGVVHARTGGRRQLIWHPGPRPDVISTPRGVHHQLYLRLRELMRRDARAWHSTDSLMINAGFDPDLVETVVERPRGQWDLPTMFFGDYGKSARKYVLGALKAYYWLECVAWRNHTRQAIDWTWIAPIEGIVKVPAMRERVRYADPYLSEKLVPDRSQRLVKRAAEREEAFRKETQQWLESHHPEKAQRYRDEQRRRALERDRKRRHEEREAREWQALLGED
jgi:hypothetical protein